MTNKPNIEALSREFCELAGIEPSGYSHSTINCPNCGYLCTGKTIFCTPPLSIYPDFTDAREVLKVMRKKDGWLEYLEKRYAYQDFIVFILDDTGLLLKEAVEWMRKEKKCKVDGRIENWICLGPTIWGDIYNDAKARFEDGKQIHTSRVLSNKPFKEGMIIQTLNSTYVLGKEAKADERT